MKRFYAIILMLALAASAAIMADAQSSGNSRQSRTTTTKKKVNVAPSYAWEVVQPLGLHKPSTIDTLFCDYSRRSVPSEISDAWACTGNLGAEGINMIYLDRPQISNFFLSDGQSAWIPSLDKLKFYNTRIPMTLLSYNTGGSRDNAQDRLSGVFSGNINKRAQVGALLDYIYSKGSYNYQAAKGLVWGFNGSYMGDRFEFQGSYNHYNLLNKENGGITNDLYITDPAELQGGVSNINDKIIPTRLNSAHTRIVGGEAYLNSRYKIGYWHEEPVNDTTVNRTYIPVTSFVWTLNFKNAHHMFLDTNPVECADFFSATYLDKSRTRDYTEYFSLQNTFGVSLLEGFHKRAKFGLSAYVTHEMRRFFQTADTVDHATALALGLTPYPEGFEGVPHRSTENLVWAGAQLTKQRGSLLTYEATGRIGVAGPAAGDLLVNASASTKFPLLGDSLHITAFGRFSNEEAPYLLKKYVSNHFVWDNNFGKERRLRLGGRLYLGRTGTHLEAAVENIQNMLYFNDMCLPSQNGGSVQVISARVKQDLKFGIFHFNNRVTFQTSSNETVLPLPKIAVYSNLFVLCRIATLHLQLGVDCDFYTKYYAPGYQPATATFHNQHETKVGNYPFMNLYANMKLSKVRFYVMFSHFNQGMMGRNYFSLPHYPLNPRRFQLGLSVDFSN